MRIFSVNIRYDNPADGEHRWDKRKDRLTKLVKDFSPDLLATQEGRRPQLENFSDLLGNDYQIIDSHRQWIDQRMYPSLYAKNLDIVRSGDIWLSETPHVAGSSSFKSQFPRLCTWVEVKSPHFFYFNVHLDHVLEETRMGQIQVLIDEAKKILSSGTPYIVGGDFNDAPKGHIYKYLLQKLNLRDPWADFGHHELCTHHPFDGTFQDGHRIDWLLHSSEIQVQSIDFIRAEKHGPYPTDHFPLKCVLNGMGQSLT